MELLLITALLGLLWETDSLGEFQKGEFRNMALTVRPELQLGRRITELAELKTATVLSLATDSRGNIYAGTGGEGGVYRIAQHPESLFSLPSGQILTLAVDRQDNLFIGTAPEGMIYRYHQGKTELWFETGEKYVWSLVVDENNTLYAATGDQGKIYRITGKAAGAVIYDSPEPHITALTCSGSTLYAGSSGNGLVYRINGKTARVIYKTARAEVKGLAVGPDDCIYAAANPDPEKSRSEENPLIYRIRPDGNATVFYQPPDSLIFAFRGYLLADRSFRLLIGTGGKARLYELETDTANLNYGQASLLLESPEGQILTLTIPRVSGQLPSVIFGTGNSGRVFRLEAEYAREGQFQSRIFDARTIARWGRCFWSGSNPIGTAISIATRSGNSDKPDDTWSDWQALNGELVASPPARYLQYQATLATADVSQTPALQRVTIAYAPTNLPPIIKSVTVKPGEDTAQRDRVITWDASDPNGDSLAVTIHIRGEEETDWQLLENDKVISRYTLDTDRLPDGWYYVRVRVSDRPSNPLGSELSATKLSPRFLIDNTPPRIDELAARPIAGRRYQLSFVARDERSLIARCELSVNLRDWRPVAPESGIFDAPTARCSVELELNPGENVIVVRAQDQAGNTGTGKRVIVVR